MATPGILLNNGSYLPANKLNFLTEQSEHGYYTSSVIIGYSGSGLVSTNLDFSNKVIFDFTTDAYPAFDFSGKFDGNGQIIRSETVHMLSFHDGLHLEAVFVQGEYNGRMRFQKDGSYLQAGNIYATSNMYVALIPYVITDNIGSTISPLCGVLIVNFSGASQYSTTSFGEFLLAIDYRLSQISGVKLDTGYAIFNSPMFTVYALGFIRFNQTLYPNQAITENYLIPYSNNLADAEFICQPSYYYYDGTAKTPTISLTLNGATLAEGIDYTLTYYDNIDMGLAYALAEAIPGGDYTGSKKCYFSIYAVPSPTSTPYGDLEPSGPGGGQMNPIGESDRILLPSIPTFSMAASGFCRIFNPTLQQLQALSQFLWTDDTFWQTVKNHVLQLFDNPMDGVIALNLLPCSIPDGGEDDVAMFYVPTGVRMTKAATQFVSVICGSVNLTAMFDSALDYAPYTKVSLFLPYIGMVSLNTDEVMGKTLAIKYHIDIVTGGCVAMVTVDGDVMYQFSGHCAITMPLTGADFSGIVGALIQTVKAAATIGAAGSGNMALAGGLSGIPVKQSTSQTKATTRNPDTGRQITVGTVVETDHTEAAFESIVGKTASNTVSSVIGSKPEVAHTGTFSGNTGYLGVRRPYIIVERPRLCNPSEYGKFNGYPSMQTVTLGNISGYTEVQQIQLTGFSATNPELNEIHALLKAGVIL